MRISAISDRSLQRGDHVCSGVGSRSCQHSLRLVLTVSLNSQQPFQEPTAHFAQLAKAFLQLRLSPVCAFVRPVLLVHAPLPSGRARQQRVPG